MSLVDAVNELYNEEQIDEQRKLAHIAPTALAATMALASTSGRGHQEPEGVAKHDAVHHPTYRDESLNDFRSTAGDLHRQIRQAATVARHDAHAAQQAKDQPEQAVSSDEVEPESDEAPEQDEDGGQLTMEEIKAFIEPHEGRRAWVYDDKTGRRLRPGDHATGKRTVGVGFNMDQSAALRRFEEAGGTEDQFRRIYYGRERMPDELIDQLFEQEIRRVARYVVRTIPDIVHYPRDVQLAMLDMAYNLGSFTKFPSMVRAMNEGDFTEAAWQMGHKGRAHGDEPSDWSQQVGRRADTLIRMVRSAADQQRVNENADPLVIMERAWIGGMGDKLNQAASVITDPHLRPRKTKRGYEKMVWGKHDRKLGSDFASKEVVFPLLQDAMDLVREKGSVSTKEAVQHLLKTYPKVQPAVVRSALRGLKSTGSIEVRGGEIRLPPPPTTDFMEATDEEVSKRQLERIIPRTERALVQQFLDVRGHGGEVRVEPNPIKGFTIAYAVPKRVYRLYKNGKLAGWVDYRRDRRRIHLVGEWQEPRSSVPTDRQESLLAYASAQSKRRRA